LPSAICLLREAISGFASGSKTRFRNSGKERNSEVAEGKQAEPIFRIPEI
jgi:hypothetical protein